METNELEEMKAQLATLNEKLEGESIVDEKHFSEATKKHVSKLQRKLICRIVMFTLWVAFFYWKLELGIFLFWSIGLLITSIYLYWVVRKGDSSMPVTEYAQKLRKALKIYKMANRIAWILTMLLILAWGTYVLILNWPSNLAQAFSVFFICFFIAFFIGISYYIGNVCVPPDVELMLEEVLDDLENTSK
jgi:hypothetical protein